MGCVVNNLKKLKGLTFITKFLYDIESLFNLVN